MKDEIMGIRLGRHVLGLAAILFGVITLTWHDFNGWQQIPFAKVSHNITLAYMAAAIEIFGGIAIQWPKTERTGALALSFLFSVFALLWIPRIAAELLIYDRWGNIFEQLSILAGALIVYATFSQSDFRQPVLLARIGYYLFGICVVSFTLEQYFYLAGTASFVPKWIPPGQMFWAITTTVLFALAAIALLSGRLALLAARLLTLMILGFQFLVWLPAPFTDPHKMINWAGNAQNLAIAGAAWVVADFLNQGISQSKAGV